MLFSLTQLTTRGDVAADESQTKAIVNVVEDCFMRRFCFLCDQEHQCPRLMQSTIHAYDVRPRENKRDVNAVSDVLPFGRFLHSGPDASSNPISYDATAVHMML